MTVALPAWLKLRCPTCGAPLSSERDGLACGAGHAYRVRAGVPQLYPLDFPPPDPRYVRWIHDYYRVPFSPRQRQKTARLIDEFLRTTAPSTPVLDVGCGRADKAALFPDGAYIGIDPIDPFAARMVDDVPAPMVCGYGERLPFESAQFASVMLFAVADQVRDREALFRECARVLRPGGSLCLLNQVVAERGSALRGLIGWVADALRSGDLRGIVAVARFSFANPVVREFASPLTAEKLAQEVARHFGEVRQAVVEGHALMLRAVK